MPTAVGVGYVAPLALRPHRASVAEARQSLASLLEQAKREGAVRIRRRDGQTFVLKPEVPSGSPLDIEGLDLDVTTEEIVSFVREGRRSTKPLRVTKE